MAVAFKTQKIEFSNEIGPKDETLTFTFASTVKSAGAAISGFRFDFVGQDIVVDVVEARATVTTRSANSVQVNVHCHFADEKRNAPYSGRIDVLASAEL